MSEPSSLRTFGKPCHRPNYDANRARLIAVVVEICDTTPAAGRPVCCFEHRIAVARSQICAARLIASADTPLVVSTVLATVGHQPSATVQ